jgi:transmembrane protein TMEM43
MEEEKNNQGGDENQPEEMQERVISEKIVSEKVIGSSSGVARFGRKVKGRISSRLGGIGLGLLLIIISFFVVWQSEKFDKSAALVADLPVLSVEQAADATGLVKVEGEITSTGIKSPIEKKDVIFYRHIREALEMVVETETETRVIERDGQDIEQTIEREVERPTWVSKIDAAAWAPLELGNKISINPDSAKKQLNLTEIYTLTEEKTRESVEALLTTDRLLVVGEISNNSISSGDPFILTNNSNEQLISSLESSEKTMWWILKIATLLLFGFGLYSLLGPLLLVLDAIPVLGNIGKTGLFIVCLVIGLIFTILSSLIIAFWYIILIILVALVAYLIYLKKQEPQIEE